MKKLGLLLMLLLAMAIGNHRIFGQSVTITLMPGWNWISVPLMDTLDFQTAMGTVTPVDGDIIKSHWGSAAYSNGQWRGTISQFYPGYGYHYKSNRMMPVFLTFTAQQPNPQGDDHEYVDLGLPSGTLWATCNVGANAPEEYGDYFAWGEIQPKDVYNGSTYQYYSCEGDHPGLIKYCNIPNYGYNGFTDDLITLLPEDDAATTNWSGDWRMPSFAEWQELYGNTTHAWTTQNGVKGMLFTATNGNNLFLPAAGRREGSSLYNAVYSGYYWSNEFHTDYPNNALFLQVRSGLDSQYYCYRNQGLSVRPVHSAPQNNTPTGAINGKFTINANGDQVYFSQGNLQYQASTNIWRFSENQWDYVGEDNANISPTYDGWIDLFSWGTSGYNHGAVCYQPWSTSQTNSDYKAYGNWNYNLFDQNGQADWGYNAILNGGNTTNTWRTLTTDEWAYLFNTRVTSSGIRCAKATINGIYGIILLPDNWNSSTYSLNSVNTGNSSFSSNVISMSDWVSVLETNGAVFLPITGSRIGFAFFNESFGEYWSSTAVTNSGARCLSIGAEGLCIEETFRGNGKGVRLVWDVE